MLADLGLLECFLLQLSWIACAELLLSCAAMVNLRVRRMPFCRASMTGFVCDVICHLCNELDAFVIGVRDHFQKPVGLVWLPFVVADQQVIAPHASSCTLEPFACSDRLIKRLFLGQSRHQLVTCFGCKKGSHF